MFNLINSQVYELQQQESLLLLEKQQQQQQQQQQPQQNKKQPNSINSIYSNRNKTNNGAYNCKSLNNLTNYINNTNNTNNSNNNNNNNNSINNLNNTNNNSNRKKKSNYGSYYRQEKLKATANFIEKFLRNEISSSESKSSQQQPIEDNKQIYYNLTNQHPNLNESNKDHQQQKELYRQRIDNNSENFNNINNNINNDGDKLKLNNIGIFYDINNSNNCENKMKRLYNIEDDYNRLDEIAVTGTTAGTELVGPNSLQIDHFNNILDKNSSDTMPSLSPSQSSTDQSSSTTTTATTTTTSSTNNSSLTNDRASSLSSSSSTTKTTNNNNETKDRILKKSNNSQQSSVLHRKKLLQVVTFLDQRNQRLEKELQNEKIQRNEELSRIVKSLLYFEAKLKSEKKVINQKLYEKDDEIARLVRMNRTLKEKLNESETGKTGTDDQVHQDVNNDEQTECKYPEALYCSNCRKEFYGLNEKCDNWTQTNGKIIENRSSCKCENNKNNNNQNNNSTEHCSSSDETLSSSFYGARRSVRYTSKRTFGTFREYMRSRCMNIDDPNIDNNMSEDENRSTLSRDGYPSQNANKKKDKLFSSAMERLHGVRRTSSFEFDSSETENRSHRKNFSSSGPETDHEHTNSPNDEGIEEDEDDIDEEDENCDEDEENYHHLSMKSFRGANVGVTTTTTTTINSKEFSETSFKQDFEASTDDWYASASDADDDQNSSVCRTKSYGYNAVNPVLECVNQILLQQSMEECITEKIGGGGGSSTGGENHYDNSFNGPLSLESNEINNTGCLSICSSSNGSGKDNNHNIGSGSGNVSTSRKRVHFSTKNSMVHVPRDDDDITEQKSCSFSDTINSSITSEHQSNNLNYESIYSNEYEPIGSEHNSSNLYVDMESKLDQDEKFNSRSKTIHHQQQQQSQNKQPPALPPKPANLIKFKRDVKISSIPPSQRHSIDSIPMQSSISSSSSSPVAKRLTKELLDKVDCDKNEKYGTEPDYCSISEVNVAIKTMQIVAEVHKSNDTNSVSSVTSVASNENSDTMSQKTSDDTEEIFADIPKLPNVAAIIAPSKNKLNKSPKNNKKSMIKNDSYNYDFTNNQSQQSLAVLQLQQQQQQQQRPQSLQLYRPKSPGQVQRKHVPNILAEINKKIQQANTVATLSPSSPNKINSNFILPISPTKRKQSNQLLPILKTSSLSIGNNNNNNNNNSGNVVNSKNFNNILLNAQTTINSLPPSIINVGKSLKSIDSNKLNQQKLASPKQQQKPNQIQLNQNKQQQHQTKIENCLPLEAEFDWYNLDAEYGKSSNRPDIIKAADVLNSCLDEYILSNNNRDRITNDINQSVEYNLDEEFSLSNQPDIIKENIRIVEDKKLDSIPGSDTESSISSIKNNNNDNIDKDDNINKNSENTENLENSINVENQSSINTLTNIEDKKLISNVIIKDTSKDCLTIINKFPTICDQTPCRQSVNTKQKNKNFVQFIDKAGLSTKPLPQQRKIYFTGPFV